MDALRNTLLELSLTASPCSNAGPANADVWGLPRPSEDDGVLSGHYTADSRHGSSWKSRRRTDSAQRLTHTQPHRLSAQPNNSFARSAAAYSSSYLSTHDVDAEGFDDRQHLRAVLRSAVGASDFSSHNSSPNTRPSRMFPSAMHGRPGDEEEEDRNLGSDDGVDDDECATQFLTMLPVSENDTEDLHSLTPLELAHRGVSSDADAALYRPTPTPPTAMAAAAGETSPVSGVAEHADAAADLSLRPLKLSMSLLQARRSATGLTPTAVVTGSRRPPLATQVTLPPPLFSPLSAAEPPPATTLLRAHSSFSSGYCVDDGVISPCVPQRPQPLLRPSPRRVSAEEGVEEEEEEKKHMSVSDVSLHALHPELWKPSRGSSADGATPTATGLSTAAAAAAPDARAGASITDKAMASTAQGLTVSLTIASVAECLSRSSPTASAAPTTTSTNTAGAAVTPARTAFPYHLGPAASETVSTPSHLSTPVVLRRNVSPLLCSTPLAPDDHAVAHVFLPPAADYSEPTATATEASGPAAPATDPPHAASNSESPRRPLLIPQPHRGGRDVHGRAVLLRAHRHFGAGPSQWKSANANSAAPLHNPASAVAGSVGSQRRHATTAESLGVLSDATDLVSSLPANVGLSAVPQPFGAYPYQWMVAADHLGGVSSSHTGGGGGFHSSEGSCSTARRRRASSVAMSHPSSSYGTLSTATPAAVASLQRSVSDGQLYTTCGAVPPQVWC